MFDFALAEDDITSRIARLYGLLGLENPPSFDPNDVSLIAQLFEWAKEYGVSADYLLWGHGSPFRADAPPLLGRQWLRAALKSQDRRQSAASRKTLACLAASLRRAVIALPAETPFALGWRLIVAEERLVAEAVTIEAVEPAPPTGGLAEVARAHADAMAVLKGEVAFKSAQPHPISWRAEF